DVGRAGSREVALVCEIRTLGELNTTHELRNQEIEIGIALAVRVRRQVHRYTSNRRREIGPVIEVESTQIVLVGLSFSAVLADDGAWHGLEDFAGTHDGTRLELVRRNRTLTRRLRDAYQTLSRILRVGKVGERRPGRDADFSAQCQVHH